MRETSCSQFPRALLTQQLSAKQCSLVALYGCAVVAQVLAGCVVQNVALIPVRTHPCDITLLQRRQLEQGLQMTVNRHVQLRCSAGVLHAAL